MSLRNISHEQLALKLKPSATLIAPVSEGIPFLGFRLFPNMIRLNRQSLRRFRRRKRVYEHAYQCGELDVEKLTASVQSMIAHIHHANSRRLQQSLLLDDQVFSRSHAIKLRQNILTIKKLYCRLG